MESELIGIGGVAGAGLVLALVGVLRRTVGTNILTDRFTPILAVGMGIGLNVLVKLDTVPTEETSWLGTVLLGTLAGLAAIGVYSGGKNIREG